MKSAYIPYLETNGKSWEELVESLELSGRRISVDVLNWEQAYPYCPICMLSMAYSNEGVLLSFFVHSLDIRTTSPGDGNYVHEDSCVEFFMQREEGDSYINFEFNAAGVCYASYHQDRHQSSKFSADDYREIKRIATFQGKRMEQTAGVYSWSVTALIPWHIMGYGVGEIPQMMRANFYKCGDKTAHPHYLSWSPIVEDFPAFHRPQFFGELYFMPG